ncbi:purine-binding chemotaxis protein CheW [Bacillus mesophilus]|uniref:chemotaxis protein CheW n=1 Tax=Bacillus mesophilus TaxID=1808955 RepID=UPI001969C371|nr:chemotaxis protein CheW [Bacillus mesophilus]MBM7660958.1 purine-binding chemotaxis protein CheW [Bacillus mesophilus]
MADQSLIDKVVVFQTQNEEYGIPIQFVVSIEKLQPLTAVPNMPDYMNGVTTVRGEITPILDTNQILYDKKTEQTDQTRMIILHSADMTYGLIVDDAKEIINVPDSSIQQLNSIAALQNSFIMGVANLEGRLLTLIDPTKLINSLEGMTEVKLQLN